AAGSVPQRADYAAQILERLVRARADHARRARDLLGRRVRPELQRAGMQAQQRDPVGKDVVHLAGDPLALGVPDLLDAQLLLCLSASQTLAFRLPATAPEHPPREDRRRK